MLGRYLLFLFLRVKRSISCSYELNTHAKYCEHYTKIVVNKKKTLQALASSTLRNLFSICKICICSC
uniref:Putative secreted protein n=1 Tax=Anopheles triannulatus TaxID=58253 RepID=A0A2M4B2W4_9DIPT